MEIDKEHLQKRIRYWKKVPRDLWDKDEIIEISGHLAKLTLKEFDEVDEFIAELIKEHNLVLTQAQKLFVENSRLKHTLKQLTTRNN